jgi:nucleoside-triphosphatase
MKRVYLLTGSPGTGKTSLIKAALADFQSHDTTVGTGIAGGNKAIDTNSPIVAFKKRAGGFYTEELRSEKGDRYGFRLVTLDGKSGTLAHIRFKTTDRVGKYGVDTKVLDELGVAAINDAVANCDVIVIDEIGRMELSSEKFKEAVLNAIESGKKVLGTVMLNHHPFADSVKRRLEVELIPVMRTNNEQVLREIKEWLQNSANA